MSDDTESDPTEPARRAALAEMQACGARTRENLEQEFGYVWDRRELIEEFEVIGFLAPLVAVQCRLDGRKGTLTFQHDPRLYYDFVETDEG